MAEDYSEELHRQPQVEDSEEPQHEHHLEFLVLDLLQQPHQEAVSEEPRQAHPHLQELLPR